MQGLPWNAQPWLPAAGQIQLPPGGWSTNFGAPLPLGPVKAPIPTFPVGPIGPVKGHRAVSTGAQIQGSLWNNSLRAIMAGLLFF